MAKKKSAKHQKNHTKHKSKPQQKRKNIGKQKEISSFKKGILTEKSVREYDRLFEQKLGNDYRHYRELKETHMQTRKFLRIMLVLITIILVAMLLLSYSR